MTNQWPIRCELIVRTSTAVRTSGSTISIGIRIGIGIGIGIGISISQVTILYTQYRTTNDIVGTTLNN